MAAKVKASSSINREQEIKELIDKFECTGRVGCEEVRAKLIRIGEPALPLLIEAFKTRELDEKIQAAKAIVAIGEKQSLLLLIESIRSDDFEIRYAAIQGLPLAGEKAIIPLMRELIEHGKEITFRFGAHVVLHEIAAVGFLKMLKPVLTALEEPQSELTAPIAAHKVLEKVGQAV